MKPYPLIFEPVFKERIWGGSRLEQIFNCKNPKGHIGEAWIVSDYPEGKSPIMNGELSGKFLSEVMKTHSEWFSQFHLEKFPLLVKLLDANDDLSVQVHPSDEYAMINEKGGSGKTECWYIIDSTPGAELTIGHRAKDRREFAELARENRWDELLVRVPVKAGEFFFIPSGAVHALGKGILLLEVQQSSDITYRIYDYDRIGLDDNKRELHLEKAIDVIEFNGENYQTVPNIVSENDLEKTILISCNYFTVEKWIVEDMHVFKSLKVFVLIYIVDGKGQLIYEDGLIHLIKGSSIMVPANMGKYKIQGRIEAIVCYINTSGV
jgi:mannose-6-phosphate isomerase